MKNYIRSIFTAIVIIASGLSASAQASEIINKISDMDNVTSVYISKAMLSLMGNSKLDDTGLPIGEIAADLKSIEIISIEDKNAIAKTKALIAKIADDPKFEIFTKVKDPDENIVIYGKTTGKIVSELLLVVEEKDEINIIYMTGDVPLDKIAKIANTL